jgi:radical SAM protein with 4Fe4S-binding SPASM domain
LAPSNLIALGAAALGVARANVSIPARPLKLNFCLTYWCQYKCKTCNIWQRRPTDELTTEEILTFIRKNGQVSWLDLTGGEIFLRSDIEEILLATVTSWKRLLLLHFPTNGFLTDRIVQAVSRITGKGTARVIVTVSLDGDEQLNDDIRGIRGGYRRQLETFRALREIPGIKVVLGMTLSSYNVGRFEETFRACQRDCPGLTIEDFHLNVAQLSDHYYGNQETDEPIVPRQNEARTELHLYRSMRGAPQSVAAWLEDEYLKRLDSFLETGRTPMRCHSLRSSCFIDPWGTVYPCITYSRPVGSLRETGMDLEAVWRSAEARNLQKEIWNGDCPQCWTACEAYQSILGNLVRRA